MTTGFIPNYWHYVQGERATQKSLPHFSCPLLPNQPANLNSLSVHSSRDEDYNTQDQENLVFAQYTVGSGLSYARSQMKNL